VNGSDLFEGLVEALAIVAAATVVGGAPALLAALWGVEIAPRRVASVVRRLIEATAALPAVVWGHLALVALVRPSPEPSRIGAWPAVVVMAAMLAPTVAYRALRALGGAPDALREASLALGATRAQTLVRAVLPAARAALFAGILRAQGRVCAEVAALAWLLSDVDLRALHPDRGGLALALVPWSHALRGVTSAASPRSSASALAAALVSLALVNTVISRRLAAPR
jgi:ABC-type phosphate transport system permease subunit